jgi:hypothetical protein
VLSGAEAGPEAHHWQVQLRVITDVSPWQRAGTNVIPAPRASWRRPWIELASPASPKDQVAGARDLGRGASPQAYAAPIDRDLALMDYYCEYSREPHG